MTVYQVKRDLVFAYGRDTEGIMLDVSRRLRDLTDAAAAADYSGQNAQEFKNQVVEHIETFNGECASAAKQLVTVVADQTTRIAQALGGQPLTIEAPVMTIDPPAIVVDLDTERADIASLNSLAAAIGTLCGQVEELWGEHKSRFDALGNEGWMGPEYDDASTQVNSLTTNILAAIETSKSAMTTTVDRQIAVLTGG